MQHGQLSPAFTEHWQIQIEICLWKDRFYLIEWSCKDASQPYKELIKIERKFLGGKKERPSILKCNFMMKHRTYWQKDQSYYRAAKIICVNKYYCVIECTLTTIFKHWIFIKINVKQNFWMQDAWYRDRAFVWALVKPHPQNVIAIHVPSYVLNSSRRTFLHHSPWFGSLRKGRLFLNSRNRGGLLAHGNWGRLGVLGQHCIKRSLGVKATLNGCLSQDRVRYGLSQHGPHVVKARIELG